MVTPTEIRVRSKSAEARFRKYHEAVVARMGTLHHIPAAERWKAVVDNAERCFEVATPTGRIAADLRRCQAWARFRLGQLGLAWLALKESDRYLAAGDCFARRRGDNLRCEFLLAEGREVEAEELWRRLHAKRTALGEAGGESQLGALFGEWARGWEDLAAMHGHPVPNGWSSRAGGCVRATAAGGGLGDQLHQLQLHQLLAGRAELVTWSVDPQLHPLAAAAIAAPHSVLAPDSAAPAIGDGERRIEGWQLPLALGCNPTMAPLPGAFCQLGTPRTRAPGRLRVAFNWCGNPCHPEDLLRSNPLEHWAQLFALPRVEWVPTQPRWTTSEAHILAAHRSVVPGEEPANFLDSARELLACDLLVTVDSASAHLGGILGVPTWILLPRGGQDPRWLLGRTDTPWYASATLWRQARFNEWAELLERVARQLVLVRDGLVEL
jgi:hypothetical protein